jgi:hypothetical protein
MDPKDLVAGLTAAAPGWSRLDLPHRELLDSLQRRAVDDLRRSGDLRSGDLRSGDLQGLAEALRTIDIARFCGAAGEGMARLREQVIQCLTERDATTYDVDPGRDGRALEAIREQATVDRVARASQFHSCELMVAGAKHTVTLRFVTTDQDLGPAQIAVAGVCPGVISKRKRVLIPHIEVRTRSLPDRMLDALDRAATANEIAPVGGAPGRSPGPAGSPWRGSRRRTGVARPRSGSPVSSKPSWRRACAPCRATCSRKWSATSSGSGSR